MGAPKGNKNAVNGKAFEQAIKRALAREGGSVEKGLDKVATKLVAAAVKGEQWAALQIGDRLDGKPKQQVELGGIPDNPVKVQPWNLQPVKPAKE